MFALVGPPTNVVPLAWVGMAGLAYALDEPLGLPKRKRLSFLVGAARATAFGVGANVVLLRFVPDVVARFTPLPWALGAVALVLLAFAEAARWTATGIVREQLALRGVPRAWAFAIGAYAGSFLPAVFPWTPAGGFTPWPAMVQLADVIGERGVFLLLALSAGLAASAARTWAASPRRSAMLATAALGLPLAMLAHGHLRMRQIDAWRAKAPEVTIALISPATGATERWDDTLARGILDRLTALTRSAEARGAELSIWPEDAYPKPVSHASRYCPTGAWAILPYGVRGPVLTGLLMTGGRGDRYNSAAICSADGALSAPYDKRHLLWFGETVPFVDQIPWIRDTFTGGTGMLPGDHSVLQTSGKIRASVLNCVEDTLPLAAREAIASGPNLLVNITNDAWFAGSRESELHLRMAAMRAVEERRDLVRAVNIGVSSFIDASGRVRARYVEDVAGTLIVTPRLLEGPMTWFGRAGDGPVAAAGALVCLFFILRTKRQGRRSQP